MPTVPKRRLGRDGPEVSAIGFGTMGLSAYYGKVPQSDEDRFRVLNTVLDSGMNHIDTANVYGDSEDLIGRWFESDPSIRPRVFLATKLGISRSGTSGASMRARGDAGYVKECIEKSFERLGVDVIDLFYVHRIDNNVPIEETISAMKEYVDAGKIRYLGLSEASASTIRRAHAVHPISALQIEYSPFSLEIEDPALGILSTTRELGIAIVAYSPLGRGMLTGAYKSRADFEEGDFRLILPRFSEENFGNNLRLADTLAGMASRKGEGVTAAQICLAWILTRGDDFFVIPGTKREKIVWENARAANVKLHEQDLKDIEKAIAECQPLGARSLTAALIFGDSAPKKE